MKESKYYKEIGIKVSIHTLRIASLELSTSHEKTKRGLGTGTRALCRVF